MVCVYVWCVLGVYDMCGCGVCMCNVCVVCVWCVWCVWEYVCVMCACGVYGVCVCVVYVYMYSVWYVCMCGVSVYGLCVCSVCISCDEGCIIQVLILLIVGVMNVLHFLSFTLGWSSSSPDS